MACQFNGALHAQGLTSKADSAPTCVSLPTNAMVRIPSTFRRLTELGI